MYNTDLPNRAELPTSRQLLRSTVIAIIVAVVLLVMIVLPAEYGVDPTRVGRVLGLTEMGEIKMTLAEEARKAAAAENAQKNSGQTPTVQPKQNTATNQPTGSNAATKSDEMTVTLKPGEGAEIKLEMAKGGKVNYDWKASGGVLNHDTHGDNASKAFISYKKGTGVTGDAGELVADFDGSHGWFWRNRTAAAVTVTLKTNGEYTSIKRVA